MADHHLETKSPRELYYQSLKTGERLSQQALRDEKNFCSNLLLVVSGIDGILISLQDTPLRHPYIQWSFWLTVLFLSIGTLLLSYVLFDISKTYHRILNTHWKNAEKELLGDAGKTFLGDPKRKIAEISKIVAYVCFFSGFLCLLVYSYLKIFTPIYCYCYMN
jgi:hypothetical protein